eukprot:1775030-Prymnesium_polylepis.2
MEPAYTNKIFRGCTQPKAAVSATLKVVPPSRLSDTLTGSALQPNWVEVQCEESGHAGEVARITIAPSTAATVPTTLTEREPSEKRTCTLLDSGDE